LSRCGFCEVEHCLDAGPELRPVHTVVIARPAAGETPRVGGSSDSPDSSQLSDQFSDQLRADAVSSARTLKMVGTYWIVGDASSAAKQLQAGLERLGVNVQRVLFGDRF